MPSLLDSLSALADYSAQIHTLAASNLAPSGPYTTAYLNSLHLNPAAGPSAKRSRPNSRTSEAGVLSLIRDAHDSEKRLFRFIGEAEVVGVGRVKKVEKRDEGVSEVGGRVGGRDWRGEDEGKDEVEAMLQTALRLVDDYRPMPRARATIASLLETHHTQLERVAELELQIEEAANTQSNAVPPHAPTTGASQPKSGPKAPPKLTFEEAVKAEEAALRAMESTLVPLRKARQVAASSKPDDTDPAFKATSTLPSSPPVPSSRPTPFPSRTPAKTPQSHRDITVANSLVNGMTPRRPYATPGGGGVLTEGFEFDRFSPLKFLGTPRAKGRGNVNPRSTLREVMGSPSIPVSEEARVGRGIFGRPRVTGPNLGQGWEGGWSVGAAGRGVEAGGQGEEEDQTIRFAPSRGPLATEEAEPVVHSGGGEDTPEPEGQPVPIEAKQVAEPDGVLQGVQYRLPLVQQAIAKIREGLSEMMRQGLPSGSEPPESIEATIKHLARLSRADPSPPPSPSSHSISTLSTTSAPGSSGPPAPPITPQTILTAHLLLSLLRGEEGAVSMTELKDDLGALARARGWESASDVTTGAAGGMVTKCIYHVVGKRVAKIDRKAGARVMFAI